MAHRIASALHYWITSALGAILDQFHISAGGRASLTHRQMCRSRSHQVSGAGLRWRHADRRRAEPTQVSWCSGASIVGSIQHLAHFRSIQRKRYRFIGNTRLSNWNRRARSPSNLAEAANSRPAATSVPRHDARGLPRLHSRRPCRSLVANS